MPPSERITQKRTPNEQILRRESMSSLLSYLGYIMKHWNVVKFAQDYRIPYSVTRKWVQMNCNFCGDSSMKGGFSISGSVSSCFKCGAHPVLDTIQKLLLCSSQEAEEIIAAYRGSYSYQKLIMDEDVAASAVDLPGRVKMRKLHRKYIESRGFDPDELTKEWGLRFTGPEDPEWRYRIIMPILHKGKLVSFQGRDVTQKEDVIRYKGARIEESVLHYKKLLYGIEKCRGGVAAPVEGAFDMYNMGPGFVCTFGTSLTHAQIRLLAKLDRVIFLFDPDDANAWKKAKKYVLELRTLGVKAERVRYDGGDPGSLSKDDVHYIRKYIGFGG